MTRQNEARLLEPGDRPTRAVAMLPPAGQQADEIDRAIRRRAGEHSSLSAFEDVWLEGAVRRHRRHRVRRTRPGPRPLDAEAIAAASATIWAASMPRSMTLLAEAASGLVLGLSLPDDKIQLAKSLQVRFLRKAQGNLTAVAMLSTEEIGRIRSEQRGEVLVPVRITDASGN
jgi:hypothetical protein